MWDDAACLPQMAADIGTRALCLLPAAPAAADLFAFPVQRALDQLVQAANCMVGKPDYFGLLCDVYCNCFTCLHFASVGECLQGSAGLYWGYGGVATLVYSCTTHENEFC